MISSARVSYIVTYCAFSLRQEYVCVSVHVYTCTKRCGVPRVPSLEYLDYFPYNIAVHSYNFIYRRVRDTSLSLSLFLAFGDWLLDQLWKKCYENRAKGILGISSFDKLAAMWCVYACVCSLKRWIGPIWCNNLARVIFYSMCLWFVCEFSHDRSGRFH